LSKEKEFRIRREKMEQALKKRLEVRFFLSKGVCISHKAIPALGAAFEQAGNKLD
jgi:hypothetical protein